METLEGWIHVCKRANDKLKDGFGPASESNEIYNAIPGKFEDDAYYAVIVDSKGKPVDWYSWSDRPGFLSGFGGWYRYSYKEFMDANPWAVGA